TALTRVQQRGREWAALGAPVELLDRAALEALTGTTRYFGGWRDRRAGTLQPLAYTRGLARAAKQAGATLHEAAAVRGIRRDGTLWRLATA
ncbi:FAD-dependent oxidoreductase, partial [Acinetobacter baumannii]